jgi:transcriptional regulator with PAS, ATPase and Fis domain
MRNLFIDKAMARAGGNLLTAANLLGIDVSTLSEFIEAEKK